MTVSSRPGGTIRHAASLDIPVVVPERGGGVMSGRSIANRSETVTVPTTRGQVEVGHQQWRSLCPGSRWQWEWLARRVGQRDWRRGSTALEAIRQAVLVAPGKQPKWLPVAAAPASAELEDL
jgi:hypothetical protein